MTRAKSLPASLGLVSVFTAGALLALACSSQRPGAVTPEQPSAAVNDTEMQLQKAASRYYGNVTAAGEHKLLWFVFEHDWTVRKHDIGTSDAVESGDTWENGERPWSVNASLAKKYPEFTGLGTGGVGSDVVSNFGGGRVLLGTDSVLVFWARYAN